MSKLFVVSLFFMFYFQVWRRSSSCRTTKRSLSRRQPPRMRPHQPVSRRNITRAPGVQGVRPDRSTTLEIIATQPWKTGGWKFWFMVSRICRICELYCFSIYGFLVYFFYPWKIWSISPVFLCIFLYTSLVRAPSPNKLTIGGPDMFFR